MSESGSQMQPSHGKVWRRQTAGQALGSPLAEWAYRTPRFPHGIKRSVLTKATPEIQRETMVVWFLANHTPAQGPYWGVGEANPPRRVDSNNTAPRKTMPANDSIENVGVGQGGSFNGGTAANRLRDEFGNIVDQPLLAEVADLFEGLWEVRPVDLQVDLKNQTPAQRSATIASALNYIADAMRQLGTAPPGGIGHNGPPVDDVSLSTFEQSVILTATAAAWSAVLSSDYRAAEVAWKMAEPVFDRVGSALGRHVDTLFNKFASTAGIIMALVATGYFGELLGLWNKAQAITAMLELAKQLAH